MGMDFKEDTESKEVQAALSNFLNHAFDSQVQNFVEHVMRDHRTLQQSFFSLIMVCLNEWAKAYAEGRYDARNEFTCKKAAEIVKQIEFMDCKRAPLI